MNKPINLADLPPPEVVEELDYESILQERKLDLIDRFPDAADALDRESSPLTKLLEENAYRETIWRQRVNEAARAVMLAFSRGADLDQMAANYAVERQVIDVGDPEAIPPVPPTLEPDRDLRRRTQAAFDGLSVAGPRSAYIYHALSADGRVSDATAISPSPAEVLVSVLSVNGDGTASAELLDIVAAALNDESVRPVADRVTVQSASITNYQIDATLHLSDGPEASLIVASAQSRINDYIEERRRIGRSIHRSAIFAALHVEGVRYVELDAPTSDVDIDDTHAGHCTDVTIDTVIRHD